MVITLDAGSWHIEVHSNTATISTGAGTSDGPAITMDRDGRLLAAFLTGFNATGNGAINDIGYYMMLKNNPPATFNIPEDFTAARKLFVRWQNGGAASGTISVFVILFIGDVIKKNSSRIPNPI